MKQKTPILSTAFCTNIHGRLKHDTKLKLDAVIENTTQETWNDAFTIILEGNKYKTLWQAVNEIDAEFAQVRKYAGQPWTKLPSGQTILKAIQNTVIRPNLN